MHMYLKYYMHLHNQAHSVLNSESQLSNFMHALEVFGIV